MCKRNSHDKNQLKKKRKKRRKKEHGMCKTNSLDKKKKKKNEASTGCVREIRSIKIKAARNV